MDLGGQCTYNHRHGYILSPFFFFFFFGVPGKISEFDAGRAGELKCCCHPILGSPCVYLFSLRLELGLAFCVQRIGLQEVLRGLLAFAHAVWCLGQPKAVQAGTQTALSTA